MRSSIALLLVLICFGVNAQTRQLRFKDGRQYALDLARRLEIPDSEIVKVFSDLRQNLPKQGTLDALISGTDAVAKLAASACTFSGYFDQGTVNVEQLYQKILDRRPTRAEKANAIKDTKGQFNFFANCLFLALHPEFIQLKVGE